jgi:RES domain-containing protein
LRHIPGDDPLDFRYAGVAADNRWNDPGTPAAYFASGWDVCVAEYGRHLDASPFGKGGRRVRHVHEFEIKLERILDLLDPDVQQQAGIVGAPGCFGDRAFCRNLARRILADSEAYQAVRVPSVAFLDNSQRWVLVVYLDRVEVGTVFVRTTQVGDIAIDPLVIRRYGFVRRSLDRCRRWLSLTAGSPLRTGKRWISGSA